MDDQECLIKALKELGYNPEVFEEAKHLYGYQGDKREQKAHIIIPRKQIGNASNDLGFEKVDGKFVMHISQYDKSSNTVKVGKLKQEYSKHRVLKQIKSKTKYSLKSQKQEEDGKIRIRIKARF